MRLAMIGLGRMGSNMARRLMRAGHECVVHDVDPAARDRLAAEGAHAAPDLAALVAALPTPRTVWVMVPAGESVEATLAALADLLSPGDTIIEGGNSNFKHSVRRAGELAARGIAMLDVGVSGGVHGLERGYCLMIGGDAAATARCAPIFAALAPGIGEAPRTPARAGFDEVAAEQGWLHCGPPGAGHYVKMVHNGIEYGMMQAFAEGFALLASAGSSSLPLERRYDFDAAAIAEVWRRGSVVSSWLLDLTADALSENPSLEGFFPQVYDSGEARWTVEAAIEQAQPAHVIAAALFARFRSREEDTFADRLLSAMRYKFGGHDAPKTSGT